MPSIVATILSSTVGLLLNKARDEAAAQLKDGDITDEKIREIVVRELNDLKTKLDGLSRKDLLSSYQMLKEGVDLLNISLGKSKLEEKAVFSEAKDSSGETSSDGFKSSIFNKALELLSHSMEKLKINSNEEFQAANERFKEARKEATHAFCIESLSIKDRIFAAKVRVVSEVLECLENPEIATRGCLSFLQELHSLPAVCDMITVYLNGGAKSMFSKAERVENVKSIMLINYVLFQYSSKFSSRCSLMLKWPKIELGERTFHPIANWQEFSTKQSIDDELMIQPPNELTVDEGMRCAHCAVNSDGDILIPYDDYIKVVFSSGERKVVTLPVLKKSKVLHQALAVNSNNNVYIVSCFESRTENGYVYSDVLFVLDENHNVKRENTLDFFKFEDYHSVEIAINQNNNIIMITVGDPHVYVCDDVGRLKHKFKVDVPAIALSILDKNDIMVKSTIPQKAVHIYSEEGTLKLKITVPEDYGLYQVAFHYDISKIIILSYDHIRWYSKDGVPETPRKLSPRECASIFSITSHPSGPVVIVREKSITYI